ncbi:MAG: ABC transporter ATP-binding protein [Oscillospiraceae bacterium]
MIVTLEHIRKTYQSPEGEVEALRDVSLGIEEGEFISIVGPSGCGKSTLLAIMAGLEKPSGGRVLLEGAEVRGVSRKVGYMPQKDELFPWRTIRGNVLLGLELQGEKSGERRQAVEELLRRYGLADFASASPSQLSGGMRQRCALIRTLATNPSLLLLDEPFSALDYQTRLSVSEDIHSIIRREKKTAILVTHDISESISMSDRVAVLSARPGRLKAVHSLAEFKGLSPMERRDDPRFHTCFNAIWKELELGV